MKEWTPELGLRLGCSKSNFWEAQTASSLQAPDVGAGMLLASRLLPEL